MLILFDIDGTLLRSYGEGIRAMQDAASDLFGTPCSIDGISYAGSLDPVIWKEICAINGVHPTDELHRRFRDGYREHLARRIERGARVERMPGVAELIDALSRCDDVAIGLVTGNYPETGRMKIETAGIMFDVFRHFGWGSDGPHRRDLPPVAIGQYEIALRRRIARDRVIVIGDTPHDVDCALHNGCRALAVATGQFDAASLHESGATRVVADLSATDDLVEWMLIEAGSGQECV